MLAVECGLDAPRNYGNPEYSTGRVMQADRPLKAQQSGQFFQQFVIYAGVEFRVSACLDIYEQLAQLPGLSFEREAAQVPLAVVECTFERAKTPETEPEPFTGDRTIEWAWSGNVCTITAPYARVRLVKSLSAVQPQLRALATVHAGPVPLAAVFSAIASAIAILREGAVLHSASIEWEAGVVAFIGPSGAGKTTACQHVPGARLFSIDRLLVAPVSGGQWQAFSVPGGTPPSRPWLRKSRVQSRPLLAVFGLRHAQSATHFEPLSSVGRVALLRQCAFDGSREPAGAAETLGNLVRLATEVPIARLHLRRGENLELKLREGFAKGFRRQPLACQSHGQRERWS